MTNQSGEQTAEQPLDVLAEQYRAELKRLSYGRATINVYLRTIRKLGQLIGSHDLPLDQLTPDIAAELVVRADWHGDRRQYAIFIVRRFVGYLTTLGLAKPPGPPTARELARAALRREYEDYLRRQRGLTEQTIGHCWRFADRFLDFRFGETEAELGASASDCGLHSGSTGMAAVRASMICDTASPRGPSSAHRLVPRRPESGARDDQADDLSRPYQAREHLLVHRSSPGIARAGRSGFESVSLQRSSRRPT